MSARSKCPDCGSSDGLAKYPNGNWCFSCGTLTPGINNVKKTGFDINLVQQDDVLTLLQKDYLNKYHLGNEDVKRYKITNNSRNNRINFGYYSNGTLIGCWMRSLDPNVKPKWLFAGNKNFNWHYKNYKYTKDVLVLVEDVISAIRVSKYCSVVCLGGTSINSRILTPLVLQYNKVVLFLDGDKAGKTATEKIKQYYKLMREVKIIKTTKDPKEYTDEELIEVLA